MVDAGPYMRLLQSADKGAADPLPISLGIVDAYDVGVDAEGELDSLYILLSGEIDVSSRLWMYFVVTWNK